ncbi:hypothetical protein NP233_g2157 [Leucocoprinus birnbaumii]|uniref:Uncharacterized protein n=1 Tax=Leucocoprinus birnbaumii TaxID=56174 RepID=A0AAD5YU40_9AGAR|nr:hypothetical protein NP233_g2157 [Leucocoprinus birnbaumii]
MSFTVSVLGHHGRGLYDPNLIESRVSIHWLHRVVVLPSIAYDYLPLNVTIAYPGGGFTFRHRFALDDDLRAADFVFSPGWLQLCGRRIPGVSLELSDGSSLSIPDSRKQEEGNSVAGETQGSYCEIVGARMPGTLTPPRSDPTDSYQTNARHDDNVTDVYKPMSPFELRHTQVLAREASQQEGGGIVDNIGFPNNPDNMR